MAERVKLSEQDMVNKYGHLELYMMAEDGFTVYRGDKVAQLKSHAELIHCDATNYSGNPDVCTIKNLIMSGIADTILVYVDNDGNSLCYGYTKDPDHPWNRYATPLEKRWM